MKSPTNYVRTIDLNADLGEGSPYDEAILAIVSSANISCGAHAGDESSITHAIRCARTHNVVIGAHPSYPDRENMGRTSLNLPLSELEASITEQLIYIKKLAKQAGTALGYVKTHGALYNDMAKDVVLAKQVCQWIVKVDASLSVMGLAGSAVEKACSSLDIPFIAEAFIDRRYQQDGTLVSRTHSDAMISDATTAVSQALQIIADQSVTTVSGSTTVVQADSLCLHGDSPHALTIAKQLRSALQNHNIDIKAKR